MIQYMWVYFDICTVNVHRYTYVDLYVYGLCHTHIPSCIQIWSMNSHSPFNSLHLHTSVIHPPFLRKFPMFVCSFHSFFAGVRLIDCLLRSFDPSIIQSFNRSIVHSIDRLIVRSFNLSIVRAFKRFFSIVPCSIGLLFVRLFVVRIIPGRFDGMIDFMPSRTWLDEIEIRTQHWLRITFRTVRASSL